jgi:hypothetical protein
VPIAEEILEARRRLGPLNRVPIAAHSMTEAHGELGRRLGGVIRRIARRRLRLTPVEELASQIATIRRVRQHVQEACRAPRDKVVGNALAEYAACLAAWAVGANLGSCLRGQTVDGSPVTADELALWLQDDEAGCQTGMLRQTDGGVLFWHTEEDTIGYFDRPRLASFTVGRQSWHAFLYPYLLPGPAFGWSEGAFHAVDSLTLRRSKQAACLACFASWVVWRLGRDASARQIHDELKPFVDGAALNTIRLVGGAVEATTIEFGHSKRDIRTLPAADGSLLFQANALSRSEGPLIREEALDRAERREYCERADRTTEMVGRLVARGRLSPEDVIGRLLASRQGGDYSYANVDVKAYCVGLATSKGLHVYVRGGPAVASDRYRPQFEA